MIDLTEPLVLACEFWHHTNTDKKATGKIEYTPGKGIKIQAVNLSGIARGESEFLHGILEGGDLFTALDAHIPNSTGMVMRNGYTSYPATIAAKSILVGSHVSTNDFVQKCRFAFHGMQEFFFAKFDSKNVPFDDEPIISTNSDYGVLSLYNYANYESVPNDLSTFIKQMGGKSKDDEFSRELSALSEKYKELGYGIRTDFGFCFRLETEKNINHNKLFDCIDEVGNFFALLLYNPVLIKFIEIILPKNDKNNMRCYLIPSFTMNQSTYNSALNYSNHNNLPIKYKDFDLATAITAWFENRHAFQIISSSIRHDIGTASTHQLYSSILMLSVHLEQITFSEDAEKKLKYQYPLVKYASADVFEQISELLKKYSTDDVGKSLGTIRDELAHVMKPKKLLPVVTSRDLILLSQLLEVVIVSWIFETKLDISKIICHEYQDRVFPLNSDLAI